MKIYEPHDDSDSENESTSQQVDSIAHPVVNATPRHGYVLLQDGNSNASSEGNASPYWQVHRSPPFDMDPRSLLATNDYETDAPLDVDAESLAAENNDTYVPPADLSPAYVRPAVDTARSPAV